MATGGEVHVWFRMTESMGETAQMTSRRLLSPEERARCGRYQLACDRRDYAAAHSLLRMSLSRYRDVPPEAWTFDVGAYGKPELAIPCRSGNRLTFNLSHARGIVACAIGFGAAVGIDVVRIHEACDYASLAPRYLSAEELVQLSACPPSDRSARFVELWALKEAYTKATGRGLSEDVSAFGFLIDRGAICFVPPANVPSTAWQFGLFTPEPHYRIAVAIECRHTPVSVFHLASEGASEATRILPLHLSTSA